MSRPKRHLLLVSKIGIGWAVLVDGQVVEKLRTQERALSWARLWQQTATQRGADVQLIVRDPEAASA